MLCLAGFDGYFKRINSAWTRTLAFTQDELRARPYLDFVHPDDRSATVAEAEQLAQGSTVIHFKNRYESRNGSYRWLAWAATPAASSQLIYAVARDITQEVDVDSELRKANLLLLRDWFCSPRWLMPSKSE
jgi:two-component system, NtrC family, sensor kinase